jgi:hypothetical protein
MLGRLACVDDLYRPSWHWFATRRSATTCLALVTTRSDLPESLPALRSRDPHAAQCPVHHKVGSYASNAVISVNGWVYGTADYPTNPPPWNSNIWFHLTDGAGWVAYPAVRAYPMTPDPDGLNPDGGPPVATSKSCQGEIQ